jgi:DNA-directed RNA polymerase
MLDDQLMERQALLEKDMQEEGIAHHRQKVQQAREKNRESTTSAGSALLRHILSPSPARQKEGFRPFAQVVQEFVDEAYSGRASRKADAAIYFKEHELEADILAFITVKTVLDSITQREDYAKTCKKVGSLVENEARFRSFKEENPGLFYVLNRDNGDSGYQYKTRLIKGYANKAGQDWSNWPLADRVKIGGKLIDLLIQATGIVEIVHETKYSTKGRKPKTKIYVQATEETTKWILEKHEHDELLCPVYMPTLVPPKRWTNPFNGGYWTKALRTTPILKTRNRNYLEDLSNQEMPEVYNSINALQETSWQINRPVYDVMKHLWNNAQECSCLPTRQPLPSPPKPVDIETNEEARKKWRQETSKTHQANRARMSRAFQIRKIMVIAERFLEEQQFYFPYCMDFRGRVYSIPMLLNPQGPDNAKALLRFAEGKRVGEEGINWLAVHGANCFGVDKLSMDQRIQWVNDNYDMIMAVAEDPLTNTQWMEADEPWQFLAFCFEWEGAMTDGYDFVSHIPIALDGSCNGLQHYSAALRDETGGAAVNLIPQEKPSDIYQAVVDAILPTVQKDAESGVDEAKQWIDSGLLTRKITKRPTMTMVYGATKYGMRSQVHETLKEIFPDTRDMPFDSDGWPASYYMGNLIYDSLAQVVSKASEAMDWLQQVAKLAASEGLPIYWMTPVGLPVQQCYKKEKMQRINTTVAGGCRLRVRIAEETDKLDTMRQANGIAPNFVHSLDAAHMMRTINKCSEAGVTHFAMIHDSYGTHAADALKMAELLREGFIEIHEFNVLEKLKQDLELQLSEENAELIPALPSPGTLDLEQIHDSIYFFA